jgi:hypothetical protein
VLTQASAATLASPPTPAGPWWLLSALLIERPPTGSGPAPNAAPIARPRWRRSHVIGVAGVFVVLEQYHYQSGRLASMGCPLLGLVLVELIHTPRMAGA